MLNGKDLMMSKKSDSLMMYSENNSPEDVYLSPKDYAGYVTLANTSTTNEVNCQTLKIIINGSLRILLLSKRKIKVG